MIKNSIQNYKSDIELYNDFLNGNNDSFNIIIQRYRKQLISFIYKYINNIDIAEDLAQDSFLYMIINKKEYDFKYSLKTYLYTIAKCRAINFLKRSKKIITFDESYMLDMDSALKKVKKEYQIASYLADFQKFKYKEISKILNKTMPQTKLLIHRARKSLGKFLKKEESIC